MKIEQTNASSRKIDYQPQTTIPTVFYVDDDSAMCESVSFLMASINLRIETFYSATKFLDTYNTSSSGCLLLDVRMPIMSGLELQEQLQERKIAIPIIFITGHGDVPMATRAMKAGAVDFLTKPFEDQTLIDSIQNALMLNHAQQKYNCIKEKLEQRIKTLTTRELEILPYVVAGNLNKVTGHTLGISQKTVELHRANIMKKIQAKSLAHLVKLMLIYDGFIDTKKCCLTNTDDHTLSQLSEELQLFH